jgi:uncharacterized cupin superfamily protein
MAVPEAKLVEKFGGLTPETPGWYIVNAADTPMGFNERAGQEVTFENWESKELEFPHFGVNIHILEPGQVNGKYHSESLQEGFLVLEGECTLLVEGQERPLRKWDYFHCPPGTAHIFVGAGDGPCAILMIGARGDGHTLHYPLEPLAEKYEAQTPEATDDPEVAYSDWSEQWVPRKGTWPVK